MLIECELASATHIRMGRNIPFSEADTLCALAVDVEGLRFPGQLEDNTVEDVTKIGVRDGHAFGVRQSLEAVLREEREQEIQGILGRLAANRLAIDVVWGQRGRSELG